VVAVALFFSPQVHQGLVVVEGQAKQMQMLAVLQVHLVKVMLVVQVHKRGFSITLVAVVALVQLEALQVFFLQ
jgi:hypothetical protein